MCKAAPPPTGPHVNLLTDGLAAGHLCVCAHGYSGCAGAGEGDLVAAGTPNTIRGGLTPLETEGDHNVLAQIWLSMRSQRLLGLRAASLRNWQS